MNEEGHNLFEQCAHVARLIGRHNNRSHKAFGPTVNPYHGQGRVLKAIKTHPCISQKELSDLLGMRQQSVGELLIKLEQNGYITRAPSAHDTRTLQATLTKAGMAIGCQTENDPSFNGPFNCLTLKEQEELSGYLARVIVEFERRFANEKKVVVKHY